MIRSTAVVAAIALALAGCQGYSPKELRVGDREPAVVSLMGPPTARHDLPGGGTRLVYARGPMGKHTYMVDLGPDGGVRQWRQVLGEVEFADIRPGMAVADLEREFGPPAEARPYRPNGGQIWSYRYPTYECQWFQVVIDRDGRVDSASYAVDPVCDAPV